MRLSLLSASLLLCVSLTYGQTPSPEPPKVDPVGVARAKAKALLILSTPREVKTAPEAVEVLPDPKDWPTSVADLLDPRFGADGRRAAVARPLNGTTYAHAVALLTRDAAQGKAFWTAVAARATSGDVKVVPGNGAVMRMVADAANGVAWGVTDTDDARVALEKGDPVAVVYPDQGEGQPGTLVIPNTAALVKGGDRPADAETFLRWLLSKENEGSLAAGPIANIPLRDDVVAPPHVKRPGKDFRAMEVDWAAVGRDRDRWQGFLAGLFQAR